MGDDNVEIAAVGTLRQSTSPWWRLRRCELASFGVAPRIGNVMHPVASDLARGHDALQLRHWAARADVARQRHVRFSRLPSRMKVLAAAFGATAVVASIGSASIDVQPVTDVFGSGYIAGADEFFTSVARQPRLNAIAAFSAACSAVAASYA